MQPDIEKLFQENHRQLDEAPPRSSWDKLHQRLENRRTRSRIRRIYIVSVAAVVFAVVSFGIVSLLYLQINADETARFSAHSYTEQLEQLDIRKGGGGIYTVQNVKSLHRSLDQHSRASQ